MFAVMYSIGDKDYEHSRYLTYADAEYMLDELDADSFDCAWIEEITE